LLTIDALNTAPPYDALSYTWDDPFTDFSDSDLRNPVSACSDSSSNLFMMVEVEARSSGCGERATMICNGREISITANLRNAL